MAKPIISVFGSSMPGTESDAYQEARRLGVLLGEAGFIVVMGGYGGTMAAVSQGASEAGTRVIGVTSSHMEKWRPMPPNEWVGEEIRLDSQRDRLLHLVMNNDGMIALPGGIGTLEEIIEIMTWAQLGRHRKPIAFVNIAGFWDPMSALINHMRDEGFIHTGNLVQPAIIDDPLAVVSTVEAMARAVHDQMLPGDDIVRM